MSKLRVAIAAVLLVTLTAAAQEVPPAPAPATPATPEAAPEKPGFIMPAYLRGIDLNGPAQAAFRTWPPKELEERAYWLPWSVLSFERAKVFNQPVFLVVTVPWNRFAQRMMEEALADPFVLRTLNHDFVSINVRADRRPDILARYGTGNWPAISLLLPDGSPMLSEVNAQGVALPITVGYTDKKGILFNLNEGRKYFDLWQNLLHGVSRVYEKRIDIEEAKAGTADAKAIEPVVKWLIGNADAKNGGFGVAPKFALRGLMEWAYLREDKQQPALVALARNTLDKMAASPLYDTREGGFHRMAAAPNWGWIQYEKMLDANVDMMREMVFALREQDDPKLRENLAGTARFVTTVLARPGGGFYVAQSADAKSPDGGGYWKAAERDAGKAPPVYKLVLSGGNALAGAVLLRVGALLEDPALERAGRAALDLVLERAIEPGRGAGHIVEPDPDSGRYLVTQSEVAFGLLDAYESTGDARYLAAAKDIAAFVRNNMRVGEELAYRDHLATTADYGLLDMPLRPLLDNARFARVLLRLAAHGALDDGRAAAESILGQYAGDLTMHGARAIEPALAIDEMVTDPLVVTIEGPASEPATQALRRAALNLKHGWTVIRSAPGTRAAASLQWRGGTRRVSAASELPEAMKALLAEEVGTP
ncbi:MAG TPA: DUF255 domain-containing protein [Candidatus Polarisedimenticolaceae bacterium]|nr:DUF255 domain-containing protein [Candidatus Polarisedimenticolaceae bacterium]